MTRDLSFMYLLWRTLVATTVVKLLISDYRPHKKHTTLSAMTIKGPSLSQSLILPSIPHTTILSMVFHLAIKTIPIDITVISPNIVISRSERESYFSPNSQNNPILQYENVFFAGDEICFLYANKRPSPKIDFLLSSFHGGCWMTRQAAILHCGMKESGEEGATSSSTHFLFFFFRSFIHL